MTSHEILSAFGKRKTIADLTGATPAAVEQWKRIGIPAKYWHEFVQAAVERGIEGVTFDALKATKPPRVAKAAKSAGQAA